MPGCDDNHYREIERCVECGGITPKGVPHTPRDCAIERERAVREKQRLEDLRDELQRHYRYPEMLPD